MIITNKISIGFKLSILTVLSLLGMIVSLLVFINLMDTNLYKEKKSQTRVLVEAGMAIIAHFHDLQIRGEMSADDARQTAMDALTSSTFGNNGYYWINNRDGLMLKNPSTPELEGKNVLDLADLKGKSLFQQFIDKAKKGGGWVEYHWPKIGNADPLRKISYVAYFKPWDWILGTGLYLDDMEKEIQGATLRGVLMISFIFIVLILTSISLASRFMRQLKDLAIHDPLTGLYTRRYLYELTPMYLSKQERNEGQLLAAIFFDVDHFKKVNDRHGHAVGDNVLIGLGKTIKHVVRKGDLGIRYGGEEFVVIMLCANKEDAVIVAERIRTEANELQFAGKDDTFSVTLSAGLAYREEKEDFDALLKRADEKLYLAKESGRDRLVWK